MDCILTFRRCSRQLCLVLATIGAVALMVMMFLIALDVIALMDALTIGKATIARSKSAVV